MDFRRLLVPVDFSDAADQAIEIAGRMARAFGAHLTVLHVVEEPPMQIAEAWVGVPPAWVHPEISDAERARALEHLREHAQDLLPPDIVWDAVVRKGYAPDEIATQARRHGHDLIVMGTHGRTGVDRLLFGSVAASVLAQSSVPVLVTRAPAHALRLALDGHAS